MLRGEGKESEAVNFDERGKKAGARSPRPKPARGGELLREGKLDEASDQFRAAIEANSDDAQAHCYLADVLALEGKTEKAAEQYLKALEIAPYFASAREGLAKLSGH